MCHNAEHEKTPFTQRDHSYITSVHCWTFLEPPTHYVSMKTVLNVSRNDHFLNPPTQTICWRNIRMVPELSRELEWEEKNLGQDQSSFFFRVWYEKDTYQRNIRIYWVRISQPFTFFYQSVEKASFFMISQTLDIELGGLKNKRVADKGQKISVVIFLGFNSSKKPTTNCHIFFPCL